MKLGSLAAMLSLQPFLKQKHTDSSSETSGSPHEETQLSIRQATDLCRKAHRLTSNSVTKASLQHQHHGNVQNPSKIPSHISHLVQTEQVLISLFNLSNLRSGRRQKVLQCHYLFGKNLSRKHKKFITLGNRLHG